VTVDTSPAAIELRPGDFYFGAEHPRIRTLLGSCVAITLWHPLLRIGGMCHYVTPSRPPGPSAVPDGRYADEAMALFRSETARHGTALGEYQAKLFGGGVQFAPHAMAPGLNVAERNVQTGLRLLADHGLTAAAHHVGGSGHRQIIFELQTGDVWVRHQGGGR